jgi:hypothetical protein
MIVLWNTIYIQAAVEQLRAEGFPVLEADIPHLNPHVHEHMNMLGRYSFAVPKSGCGPHLFDRDSRCPRKADVAS